MKLKIFSAVALFSFFLSCNSNKRDLDVSIVVVQSAFDKLYPTATNVERTAQRSYVSFTFKLEGNDAVAWFSDAGKWVTTTITHSLSATPVAVKSTVTDQYHSSIIEDIYQYRQVNAPDVYVVNIEQSKTWDALMIRENGLMVDRFASDYSPKLNVAIPILALTDMLNRYPRSVAFNMVEYSDNYFGIFLLSEDRVKYALYDPQDEWLQGYYDITEAEIPADVQAVLDGYPQHTLAIMRHYTTVRGEFYRFILDTNAQENIYVNLKADGTKWQ